jgi:hypothetical protein
VTDQEAAVVIGRERVAALVVGRPEVTDNGYARVPISISSRELMASGTIELEDWSGGLSRLPQFFDELAASWRGWPGAKEWRDDGGTVSLTATHDGVGQVGLHAALSALPYDPPGSWRASIEVPVEPGNLQAIADDLRRLVSGDIRQR